MSEPNWVNKTIWTGDNLPIMRGMNSDSVDLIYLDPPFNSNANYAAPIGSKAAGAEFKDTWTLSEVDVAWLDLIETKHPKLHHVILAAMSESDQSYLIYMAVRLLEMRRLLKPTGSIYLHCDPTMSHYLKLVMDAIFIKEGGSIRNEIVWCYTGPGSPKMRQFNRKHDTIFWYVKGEKWVFNGDKVRVPHADGGPHVGGYGITADISVEYGRKGKIPETWWQIRIAPRSKTEYVGYPTQKPIILLERIITASSNRGDVVFDPFCGCATTLVGADRLSREWVGIDISSKAVELVKDRLKDEHILQRVDITPRTDIPQRTDIGEIPPYNSTDNKEKLYGAQGGYCAACKVHFEQRNLEVDHIIAKKSGGTDHIDNLQLLCGNCNRIKGNRGQEYLLARLNQ